MVDMVMPEKAIEKKVVKWAEDHGIVCIKFTPKGDVGWPDHIFIVPPTGIHAWVEFKAPGEEPTPIQAHRMTTINEAGGIAFWTDETEAAIDILTKLLEAEHHEQERAEGIDRVPACGPGGSTKPRCGGHHPAHQDDEHPACYGR